MKKEVYTRTFDKESFELNGVDSLQMAEWKRMGIFDDMMSSYWIESTNENHPYYWYEKAIKARTSEDETELMRCLEQCVACDPDYLHVVQVAKTADEEVKASAKVVKLFETFYLNEIRKRKETAQ